MINIVNKVGIEGIYFNIIKLISISLVKSFLKAFSLRPRIAQGCSLSPFLYTIYEKLQLEQLVKKK